FAGKLLLIRPALGAHLYWLVILTVINAGISAGYYLRIVGTMFLRPEPEVEAAQRGGTVTRISRATTAGPLLTCVALSAGATILFGAIVPATQVLSHQATLRASIEAVQTRAQRAGAASNVP